MRACAYLLAQYLFFGVTVFLSVVVGFALTSRTRKGGKVACEATPIPFNTTSDPSVIAHVTDVHVETARAAPGQNLDMVLRHVEQTGIATCLITGDLVDNMEENWVLIHGYQKRSDFVEYSKIVGEHVKAGLNLIDIPGNHDEFKVGSMFSTNHYVISFSEFVANKMKPESHSDYVLMTYENQDVELVLFNPYLYPQVSTLIGYKVWPSTDLLDRLERILLAPSSKPYRLFAMHFNVWDIYNNVRSSMGRSFQDIIDEAKVSVILTGHLHPKGYQVHYHNGNIEIVGSDLVTNKKWSIAAFDNGVFSYHEYSMNDVPVGMITHPAPKTQVSKSSAFNRNDMEIRVVVFRKDPNMTIRVKGSIEGVLSFDRFVGESMNLSLYSLPIHVPNGEYHIELEGDYEETLDFVVGNEVMTADEVVISRDWVYVILHSLLLLSFITLMIILCPYSVPKTAEEIRAWIDGECDDESFDLAKNHPYKLLGLVCLLGPFIRKARIDKTPMRVRITLLLGSLAFIFVPSLIASMDGNLLIVNIIGYVISGNYRLDPWGRCFCSLYLLTIISPLTVLVPVMFNKFQRA